MDQIAVITLWMVATQIGHAFADQMYGCVDRKTSNGFGNANAMAMSAIAPCRFSGPDNRIADRANSIPNQPAKTTETRPKQRFEPCQCCQWRSATIE